jgi:hypothetical protein
VRAACLGEPLRAILAATACQTIEQVELAISVSDFFVAA